MNTNITIIGLGAIGSSMGYTLRSRKRKGVQVVGYDMDSKVQARAAKTGAVDRVEWKLPDAVRDADLVVVATPSLAVKELLADVAPHLKPGATVTDTTTSKRNVTAWAEETLPRSAGFVGGHPLVGLGSGIENARADAFEGVQYALTPTPHAPQESVRTMVRFVERLGAKPFFVGLDEHDSYVTAVSHLPIIVSTALMMAAASSPSWREISRFASDDFRDFTRLASNDPEVNLGASSSNADMLLRWIDQILSELADLRVMIEHEGRADKEGPLMATFINAWEARTRWQAGVTPGEIERPPLPKASDTLLALFVGEKIASRIRDTGKRRDDTSYRGRS